MGCWVFVCRVISGVLPMVDNNFVASTSVRILYGETLVTRCWACSALHFCCVSAGH
jgi:hypothetical protein